jgi:hypothetical protein
MRNPWKLTSFALAAALAANTLVPAVSADPQPKMRAALDSLRDAKRSLDAATPDKGGHRAKAIDHVKAAIDEVEAGIKFDNKH